jgi:hypothetical protein
MIESSLRKWSFNMEQFLDLETTSILEDIWGNIFLPCNLNWLIIGILETKFDINPAAFVHYYSNILYAVSRENPAMSKRALTARLVAT